MEVTIHRRRLQKRKWLSSIAVVVIWSLLAASEAAFAGDEPLILAPNNAAWGIPELEHLRSIQVNYYLDNGVGLLRDDEHPGNVPERGMHKFLSHFRDPWRRSTGEGYEDCKMFARITLKSFTRSAWLDVGMNQETGVTQAFMSVWGGPGTKSKGYVSCVREPIALRVDCIDILRIALPAAKWVEEIPEPLPFEFENAGQWKELDERRKQLR